MRSSSRHYLFDPSADMLYNPWLAPKTAWPQKDEKRSKEYSRQFMDQHVNRELVQKFSLTLAYLNASDDIKWLLNPLPLPKYIVGCQGLVLL